MRIVLDHCVDWRLARSLGGHDVKSASDMGWERLRNGNLLAAAAGDFEVLLTVDQNIRHQQNLANLPIAVVAVEAPTNRLRDILPLVPQIRCALEMNAPGTLVVVNPHYSGCRRRLSHDCEVANGMTKSGQCARSAPLPP